MRVLIVDDHSFLRRGIREILLEGELVTETGEAGDGGEAMRMLHGSTWDMVLLDLNLPGRRGIEVLKEIKQSFPKLPVLIVSSYPEEQYAVRLIKTGAQGYLTKDSAPEKLIHAIQVIAEGNRYIGEKVAQLMADDIYNSQGEEDTRPPHLRLSNRENEVFLLLARGVPLTEIAEKLSVSVKTISTHRTRILKKTGMKNNAEITIYAAQAGLLGEMNA
jgi:DNA-binding NarL/FixJ family response regulator